MNSIRKQLAFGFGGVIVVLLAVCALGVAVLWQYQGALDRFLYENWRSIQYGQAIVDSLGTVDELARNETEAGAVSAETVSELRRQASAPLAEIDRNVDAENKNITLHPEEDRLAAELTDKWFGKQGYKARFEALTADEATPEARREAYNALRALSPQVKSAAQAVIALNLKNMTPIEGRAKAMADSAGRAMIMLAIAGIALAVAFLVVASRAILRPLRTLTQSAREIEQGNLDLTVPVKSRDEVGQLAAAFNSMAAKLREFRRTDRAKLVRTQRTTQLALGSLPDAVAIVSPEGRVEIANGTAQKLFGLRPETELKAVAAPAMAELFERAVTERRAIQARGYDAAIQIFNGQERFFLPTAVPIIDEDNQLAGVTMVLADVTNLRKLDSMKSGLLSVVSHELKTPLTSIRMATHLLLEERVGSLTAKQIELVTAAKEDSDRLNEIIENLLDMGRIEAGRELIEIKPVPVDRLVNAALDEARSAYRDKGVSLEADIPADVPNVQADPDRISHVFSNLLNNALKFTPSGGHVRIEAHGGDDVVRFTISDTGIGIAPDALPRVFERFYRAPGQPNRSGAGLGLAIAKEIVEVHGGSISAQSTPGAGSRFSFTLSRADIHQAQTQKARSV